MRHGDPGAQGGMAAVVAPKGPFEWWSAMELTGEVEFQAARSSIAFRQARPCRAQAARQGAGGQ